LELYTIAGKIFMPKYGGQHQGGISASKSHNLIFLFLQNRLGIWLLWSLSHWWCLLLYRGGTTRRYSNSTI